MGEVSQFDLCCMQEALTLARDAEKLGEVPVGAVVAHDQRVIGRGMTQQIVDSDPSAHAEVVALRDAGSYLGNHRLVGSTLYVTMEPCMMCAGLLIHARIAKLVYGCDAPKTGVIRSNGQLLEWPSHNHHVEVVHGVLEEQCARVLQEFFMRKRDPD